MLPKNKILIRNTVHLRKGNTGVLALLLVCALKRVPGFVLAAFYVAIVHVLCCCGCFNSLYGVLPIYSMWCMSLAFSWTFLVAFKDL